MKFTYIVLFTLFINEVNAQYSIAGSAGAIYIDIIPDTLLNPYPQPGGHEYYNVDINQDVVNEIKIDALAFTSPGSWKFHVNISSLDSFVSFSLGSIDSTYVPYTQNCIDSTWLIRSIMKIYDNGDTIRNGNYVTSGYLGYSSSGLSPLCGSANADSPEWVNKGDVFFGVKYQTASDTSYGWVKVNVTQYHHVLIKEFSLGSPLASVNSPTDISNSIKVYPNPAVDKIYIDQIHNNTMNISVLDVVGKPVIRDLISESKKTEVDFGTLTPGIYFVQIKTEGGIVTKKIVIQR